MIGLPFAHVGGIPIEETIGAFGPALLVGLGVTWSRLRARLSTVRSRAGEHGRAGRTSGGWSAGVRGRSGA